MEYSPPTGQLALAFQDLNRLGLVSVDDDCLLDYQFPTHIGPVGVHSVGVSGGESWLFVHNLSSHTFFRIRGSKLNDWGQRLYADGKPGAAQSQYVSAVAQAYASLAAKLGQYLKDCFCHHLLVSCPPCHDEHPLYLASVQARYDVKNKQWLVYDVCNFSLRKYVKSFPTYGYWLSLVPVLPWLKSVVASMCCATLPDAMKTLVTTYLTSPPSSIDGVQGVHVRNAVERIAQIQPSSTAQAVRTKVTGLGSLGGDVVLAALLKDPAAAAPGIATVQYQGQTVSQVVSSLTLQGYPVAISDAPTGTPSSLLDYAKLPAQIPKGTKVEIVQQGGVVRYIRPAAATAAMPDLSTQMTGVQARTNAIAADLEASDQNQLSELAARDQKIAALQQQVTTLTAVQASMSQSYEARISKLESLASAKG